MGMAVGLFKSRVLSNSDASGEISKGLLMPKHAVRLFAGTFRVPRNFLVDVLLTKGNSGRDQR